MISIRQPSRLHVRVQVVGGRLGVNTLSGPIEALAVDVSMGGIGFHSPERLTVDERGVVLFSLPDEAGQEFEMVVRGSFTHSVLDVKSGAYQTGFVFDTLTKAQYRVLLAYVGAKE